MTAGPFPERSDAFAAIAAIDLRALDLDGVLTRLAELTRRALPGTAAASFTLHRGKRPTTVLFAGELARLLDETQSERGRGPCLQAFGSGDTVVVNDMRGEHEWPDFAVHALDAGCHSLMSIGFPRHNWAGGALNVFATGPRAFDDYAVALGQAIAGHAAVAVAHAHLSAAQAALDRQHKAVSGGGSVFQPAVGVNEH